MSDITISYDREVEVKEYITINGRRSRIHYNGGYMYTSWLGKNGTVAVHRIIVELKLSRPLEKGEHVHHIDGNRMNNAPDNLEVVVGREHNRYHTTQRNLKHDPNNFVCVKCGGTKAPHKAFGLCENCWAKLRHRQRSERPCHICCRETRGRGVYRGLCAGCAMKTWDHCRFCGRSRDELPKCKPIINPEGLCRACSARLASQLSD